MSPREKYSNAEFKEFLRELIERCKEGDHMAQFQVYRLYYRMMYSVSHSIVEDQEIAESIVQESFLLAFDQLSVCDELLTFGAWLRKIVTERSERSLRLVRSKINNIADQSHSSSLWTSRILNSEY
jgi:RNA polymerase sigma-70 factor (ECF subfamily)